MSNSFLPCLLLGALLAAGCARSLAPSGSTETGNPPTIDPAGLTLVEREGAAILVAEPGSVTPGGASVRVTNARTGMSVEVEAQADGSFEVKVPGTPDDTFELEVSADGEVSSPVEIGAGIVSDAGGLPDAAISADAGSLPSSCVELLETADDAMREAVEEADRSCESDIDCVYAGYATDCTVTCYPVAVSTQGAAQVRQAVDETNAGLCATAIERTCMLPPAQPCPAAQTSLACIEGSCGEHRDFSCSQCLDYAVVWGMSGGFDDPTQPSQELAGCRNYRYAVEEMWCDKDLPGCGGAAEYRIDDVLRALAHPDVPQVVAGAEPLLVDFGRVNRAPDAAVFTIDLDRGQVRIGLGEPCGGAPDCTPIPPGVATLLEVLEGVAEQQVCFSDM